MANTSQKLDKKILASCMVRLRQGGAVIKPASQQRKLLGHYFNTVGRFYHGLGVSNPGKKLLSLPDMAIFYALAQGPKALEAACAAADPALIDAPLFQCAGSGLGLPQVELPAAYRFTALQLCARSDLWREARILIEHGANPNFFNAEVTAIGLAAYAGSPRVLAEMIASGANATLYLSPEHSPKATGAHGTTLLHRVANRSIGQNKQAIVLLLAHCVASYPEVLPKALDGSTPLDWADDDETRSSILSAVADREATLLRAGSKRTVRLGASLRM